MRRIPILVILGLLAAGFVWMLRSTGPAAEPVTLSDAVAQVIGPGEVRVFVTLRNGAAPNVLRAVSSAEAAEARILGSDQVVLPADSAPGFAADGAHLVLSGIQGALDDGRLLPIRLEFEPSGVATTRARIETPSDPHALHRGGAAEAEVPPQITLSATPDGAGWALRVETQHFTFTPETPDPQHIPGEGHGHLYLNGLKLQRVYTQDLRIGALPPGRHEVTVSLNGNTHLPYLTDTGPVAASVWIETD